ncbi:MAG TPA: anti-sigma factor [Gemmatimonadales bacterium]|nr:anti-sigma factor [Gemmatimonadales bacterium]
MICDEIRVRLDAWVDDELPPAEMAEFDAHVGQCANCRTLQERRLALRDVLARELPKFEAPQSLRRDLEEAAHRAASGSMRATRKPGAWWALAVAASLAIVATGSWQLATTRANGEMLTQTVLESHVRSLIGEHLTDVVSSDLHTVKPWFNGRLDFSPPVYDFAGRGYPLLGGRLEYVGERKVAALVYGRRKHVINVFLWPADAGMALGPQAATRHGYHLLHWNGADFTYWVVSDLGTTELQEFAGLLEDADSAAAAPATSQ